MTSTHDSSNPDNGPLNRSGTESSSGQLVEIIRHLKREKEILIGKVSVAESQSQRFKMELETAKRELDKDRLTPQATAERAEQESSLPSAKLKDLQVRFAVSKIERLFLYMTLLGRGLIWWGMYHLSRRRWTTIPVKSVSYSVYEGKHLFVSAVSGLFFMLIYPGPCAVVHLLLLKFSMDKMLLS